MAFPTPRPAIRHFGARSGAAEARTGDRAPRSRSELRPAARRTAFGRRSAYAARRPGRGGGGPAGSPCGAAAKPRRRLVAAATGAPWSGKIASVSRASADKSGGLEACDAAGACAPLAAGAALPEGATLRTDARTRAHLSLADGSALAIDRGSRAWIAVSGRRARVDEGAVVLDVTPAPGAPPARIEVPHGQIEVLGTKLAITAGDARASVEVARGAVRVTGERRRAGRGARRRGGDAREERRAGGRERHVARRHARVERPLAPRRPTPRCSAASASSGARKPGATQEKDQAVRLAKARGQGADRRRRRPHRGRRDVHQRHRRGARGHLPVPRCRRARRSSGSRSRSTASWSRARSSIAITGAAIWRGVIQNAAPKAPKPREEIIWVPARGAIRRCSSGSAGGRFELRIFPIPKRGSRRVVLTLHAGSSSRPAASGASPTRSRTTPAARRTSATSRSRPAGARPRQAVRASRRAATSSPPHLRGRRGRAPHAAAPTASRRRAISRSSTRSPIATGP